MTGKWTEEAFAERKAEVKVELAEAKERGDKIIYIDESMFSYKMKEIRTW